MSIQDQDIEKLLSVIFDPNASDSAVDSAINVAFKMSREDIDKEKSDRPKNKKAVCALLASQSEDTSLKELEYFLTKYYRSIEVAKLVARHPSLGVAWLAKFMHYLPEDAQANPKLKTHSVHEDWEKCMADKPQQAKSRYWNHGNVKSHTVDEDRPDIFKVLYWLKNGKAADKNYIAGLRKVEEKWLLPFAKDPSAHVRKTLAKRHRLSMELASVLVADRAKTVRQALAENESCPGDILGTLTQDKEAVVSQAAMANKACPTDAIHAARLAEKLKPKPKAVPLNKSTDAEIIALLADPNTGIDVLEPLSQYPQNYVRAGVAFHQQTDAKILAKLAKDSHRMVKMSVAYNPNTSAKLLQQLLDCKDSQLNLAVATNPNLTEQQQLALITSADESCLRVLADCTEFNTVWQALSETQPPARKKKSKHPSWRECITMCLNPAGKGLYALQRSTKTRWHFVNKLIARHPKCTASLKPHYAFYLFSSLAKNPQIALQLLENPSAIKPKEYAEWKIKDWLMYENVPGHVVKYYLHSNEVKYARKSVLCPTAQLVDIQAQVFNDDIHMKKNMASIPQATQFMLEILARDKKESVRATVVANKHCPAEVLAHLVTDKVAAIRISAQSHKNFDPKMVSADIDTSQIESLKNKGPKRNRIKQAKETKSLDVIRDLAGDKLAEVRLHAISNDKTPLDVLDNLKDDEDAKVRSVACTHRNSNVAISRHLLQDPDDRVRYDALRVYSYRKAKKPSKEQLKARTYNKYDKVFEQSVFEAFYQDSSEIIRSFVANRVTDPGVQVLFIKDDSDKVKEALAANLDLSEDLALRLIDTGLRRVIQKLAEKTVNKKVFLATLLHDDVIKDVVWRNDLVRTHSDIQRQMMTSNNAKVRSVVAGCATQDDIIMSCVSDKSNEVLQSSAYNESLKQDHLEVLLNHANEGVMSGLYSYHEKYLKKMKNQLAGHQNDQVRAFMAQYFTFSADLVERLISDESPLVRHNLIENYEIKLTDDQIEALRKDTHPKVKQAMKWRFD